MLVTGVAFGVFMIEALVHYNMGESKAKDDRFRFRLPPDDELMKIVAVTAVASVATGVVVSALARRP